MTQAAPDDERLLREAQFHDRWASSADVARIRVREVFESPVAMENKFILQRMGPLTGKRLLDVGAGLGESAVYFALQGARVTACDVSPAMIRCTQELANYWRVDVESIVGSAETMDVGCERFDFVYAANLLHHVTDKLAFLDRVRTALEPGGQVFLIDPLRYNPAINAYRRMASHVRSEDERPLGLEDLRIFCQFFVDVGHQEFWMLGLALFLKYYFWDHVHPNQDRYWKRIFNETPASLRWWQPLNRADQILTRLPGLRWLSWNMVAWGKKGKQ